MAISGTNKPTLIQYLVSIWNWGIKPPSSHTVVGNPLGTPSLPRGAFILSLNKLSCICAHPSLSVKLVLWLCETRSLKADPLWLTPKPVRLNGGFWPYPNLPFHFALGLPNLQKCEK
jgi:hypothetical protein